MKIIFKYTWQLICCVLVILLLLQRQCTPEPKTVNSHTVDTIRDTIPMHDTIPEHVPALVIHDTIYPDVPFDTLDLIADYFAVKSANDTLQGENYIVIIQDKISRNRIQSRKANAKINVLKETIHITDSIPVPCNCPKARNKVYAGIGVGGWTDKVGFAPSLALNTKKDNLYTASYDVISRTAWISMYWKIKIKK